MAKRHRFHGLRDSKELQNNLDNNNDELAFYQAAIDQCQEQDAKHQELVARDIESVREVWCMYLFGLAKISKLQDLQEAPDAIMPGNFVVTQDNKDDDVINTKIQESKSNGN